MQYPGRIIKVSENDANLVKAIKHQLNIVLVLLNDTKLKLDEADPTFGQNMKQAVKLFQARTADSEGMPLKQDGEVGSLTWSALFGQHTVIVSMHAESGFLSKVVEIAGAEESAKVREIPLGSNRGPRVDEYLITTGNSVGSYWCCAFVYWCFDEASKKTVPPRENPMVKTASCLDHWNRAISKGAKRITKAQAVNNTSLLKPGMIFIINHGGGYGHTGIIESVNGGYITTIEGNTNPDMSNNGYGVFRLRRKIADINKGFIDYTGV